MQLRSHAERLYRNKGQQMEDFKEECKVKGKSSGWVAPVGGQLSSGGPYLVGIDNEEALQLVVCNLWRKSMNGEHPTGFW